MTSPLNTNHNGTMVDFIIHIAPKHNVWCEPFFCEGEVFFKKKPSQKEIVNDPDNRIINFYHMIRSRWEQLSFLMQSTLHADFMVSLWPNVLLRMKQKIIYAKHGRFGYFTTKLLCLMMDAVADTYHPLTGEVSYTKKNDMQIPSTHHYKKELSTDGKGYSLLGSVSFLVQDKELVNTTAVLSAEDISPIEIVLNNVPVRKSSATDITGCFLTTEVTFNVSIEPNFNGEYEMK